MAARSVAAQRAISKGPSLVIPKGRAVLPKVAPTGVAQVRNDHQANPGGGRKGLSKGEHPRKGK